jgi:hypothetical protein
MSRPPTKPENTPLETFSSRVILGNLKVHRGAKAIASFLEVHERTVTAYAASKKWPIRRDPSGTLVLAEIDYYLALTDGRVKADGPRRPRT